MNQSSLKQGLKDWTDFDGAAFQLAVSLGLMNADTSLVKAKHVFWSTNAIGTMLYNILTLLTERGILEYRDEPDHQYRWNSNFKGTWE